ncbi:hypothetical protein LQF76_04500 [Gloeomargaritales cyanobacterium VI4D9]|nr:hypothetical protein LQF76_04500 [Gloeomargaritales cyanobacterium VI4D9]
MASPDAVRQYLACWLQVGKGVVDGQTTWRPERISQGNDYSPEFLSRWREMEQRGLHRYYLAGTEVSLGQLCGDDWEIVACSRCTMPIPVKVLGMMTSPCPCSDLSLWPHLGLPLPHGVVDSRVRLAELQVRLQEES